MAREYRKELFDRICEYCDQQGWKSRKADTEHGVITLRMSLDNKLKGIDLRIWVSETGFATYGIPPIAADKDSIGAVSEFVILANEALIYGNFEINTNDGEVLFRSSMICGEKFLPPLDLVEAVVDLPIFMWQKYGNQYLDVVVGGKDPAKVMA